MSLGQEFHRLLIELLDAESSNASANVLDDFIVNRVEIPISELAVGQHADGYMALAEAIRECYFAAMILGFGDRDESIVVDAYASWMRAQQYISEPWLRLPDDGSTPSSEDVVLILASLSGFLESLEGDERRFVGEILDEQISIRMRALAEMTECLLAENGSDRDGWVMSDFMELRDEVEWCIGAIEYLQFDSPGRLSSIDTSVLRLESGGLDALVRQFLRRVQTPATASSKKRSVNSDFPESFWWHR